VKHAPNGEQQHEFCITLVSHRMRGLLKESANHWASYGWLSSLASVEQHLEYRALSAQATPAAAVKLELPVEEAQVLELLCRVVAPPATGHPGLEEHQTRLALSAATRVRQALEKPQDTSDDSDTYLVGGLVNMIWRYINACALLGHVAAQIEDENDHEAVEQIMRDCARSFSGALEVLATDDGGWFLTSTTPSR
jgi:hypothetical protein